MIRWAILFIFYFQCVYCHAQFYFKHYQVENGLSNNTVTSMVQDAKGFMWFGTKDGLNRFDGYQFRAFKKSTAINSLPSNSIKQLSLDAEKNMWVATEKGLCRYDALAEKFIILPDTYNKNISHFLFIKDALWYIADYNLYKYTITKKQLQNFTELYTFYGISCISTDAYDNLWLGTLDGLIARYDDRNYTFNKYRAVENNAAYGSLEINDLAEWQHGKILVATAKAGVKLFNTNNKTCVDFFQQKEYKNVFARTLAVYDDGVWIGTETGLLIYKNNSQIFHLNKNEGTPYAISDNAVYKIYRDYEGGTWVATYFGGINYHSNNSLQLKKYMPIPGKNAISGSAVREITETGDGKLWIGTEDAGLNKYDPVKDVFYPINITGKNGVPHTNIHGLAKRGTQIWVGTFENGLDVLDSKTAQVIKHYNANNPASGLKSNFIHSIYSAPDGRLYLSTSNGCYIYNPAADNFRLISQLPFNTFYTNMVAADSNTILVGSFTKGVLWFNKKSTASGSVKILQNGINTLEQKRVTYLYKDSRAGLWICTEDGLYKINAQHTYALAYHTGTGLPSNMIYGIVEDRLNNLWITTSAGLVCLNSNTGKMRIYTKADGLLSDQFNYSSVFLAANNILYFGTTKGLTAISTSVNMVDNKNVPIYFTDFDFLKNDRDNDTAAQALYRQLKARQAVTLPYNQATFTVDFAGLHYTAPENIKYAYRITGLSNQWNYIKNNRKIFFNNLPAGNYTLTVRSTNSNGEWLHNDVAVSIKILPPWWLNNFSKAGYILAMLFFMIAVYWWLNKKNRAAQKRKMQLFEIQKQKEFYETKMDFFTKVAHEIKTPVTLIKGPADKLLQTNALTGSIAKKISLISRNADRLFELTNQLLDFRKAEISGLALNYQSVNLLYLIQEMINDFNVMQDVNKKTAINFNYQAGSYNLNTDADILQKIIANLLSNAVKYSSQEIKIKMWRTGQYIYTQFINDGDIIPLHHRDDIFKPFFRLKENDHAGGTGIGLSLAQSLTTLLHGTLELVTTETNNNTFLLILPDNL